MTTQDGRTPDTKERKAAQDMDKDRTGINSIKLSGNLVGDATTKTFENGSTAVNFRIAVNRRYKGHDGGERTETIYINATTYPERGKEAAVAGFLKRGAAVYLEGALTCRISDWQGHRREFFEVRAFDVRPIGRSAERSRETAA